MTDPLTPDKLTQIAQVAQAALGPDDGVDDRPLWELAPKVAVGYLCGKYLGEPLVRKLVAYIDIRDEAHLETIQQQALRIEDEYKARCEFVDLFKAALERAESAEARLAALTEAHERLKAELDTEIAAHKLAH